MKEPLIPQGRKESISSDRKSSVISRITIQGDIDLFEAIENQNKEGIIKYLSYHPEAKITNFLAILVPRKCAISITSILCF